jgi:hypothetical protein
MMRVAALKPPPLPKEHGAWAMLCTPLLLGIAAVRFVQPAAFLAAAAVVLAFLGRSAAVPSAMRWLAGKPLPEGHLGRRLGWLSLYMGASAACLSSAILLAPPPVRSAAIGSAVVTGLLAAAHSGFALAGRERTIAGEIVGMAGLASSSPLLLAVSGRPLGGPALGLAGLSLAYFLSSLSFVRAYRAPATAHRLAVGACLAAHLLLAAAVGALWWMLWIPPLAALAFVTVLARTVWGLLAPPKDLRALGLREVIVALVFVSLAALGLAL